MKILITTGIFPPDVGGPATYSQLLATQLAKRGHEVRVVAYADKNSPRPSLSKRGDGGEFKLIRIVRSPFKLWRYFQFFRAVKKYGREADVIYAQGPVSEGYPSYLATRVLKKPLVVKVTGDYSWEQAVNRGLTDKLIDEFQTLGRYPPQIKRMRDIQKTVCTHARIIITPSEYLKKIVVGWGINESKVRVIYNAVKKPELRIEKQELRKKYGIKDSTFLVLSSGRDVPWKGFKMLREVVSELQKSNPDIELKVLHHSPRTEFHEYVGAADVYVLNTGYEGLSNTLVEVLHLGTPIITTNVCGNPEIITSLPFPPHEGGTAGGLSANGILIDYNNKEQLKQAIELLYSHKELRDKLSHSVGLEKFNLEYMITQTAEVLSIVARSDSNHR